jgi:hypothetical protein
MIQITLPKLWCQNFLSNLRNFKVLKICSQNQLVKIDHIFDDSFENCTKYCDCAYLSNYRCIIKILFSIFRKILNRKLRILKIRLL